MNKFSGKASLMATLVAAWVGASSAQAAEIKIGVVLPLSGAVSLRKKGWILSRALRRR